MATTSTETLSLNSERPPLKTAEKAAAVVIQRATALPPDYANQIREAKNLPIEEIDRRLAMLTDATARPEGMKAPNELPMQVVKSISETAQTLLDIMPRDIHTEQTLSALARASDDTGQPELLEEALRIAEENDISGLARPNLTEALENASHHNIPFRDAYKEVQDQHRRDISTPVRKGLPKNNTKSKNNTNDAVHIGPEFNWVFRDESVDYGRFRRLPRLRNGRNST